MSSTGRGAIRVPGDYYKTPRWCVEAIVPHLPPDPLCVVDPGCGDGAIGAVVGPHYDVVTVGYELDEARAREASKSGHYTTVHCADWLGASSGRFPESGTLIIGNPPYSLAMEFVQRSRELAGPGGTVAMLLRLPWLAGQKRAAWHRANQCDVYVLPKRPSFTGKGTDSCDYAWMVWGPGHGGRWSVLEAPRAA